MPRSLVFALLFACVAPAFAEAPATLPGTNDRTRLEFCDGPHTIHGQGTFAFLHEHLHWPERR